MAAFVLPQRVNMKLLAALISIISLPGFTWGACPIPNPLNPSPGQESALGAFDQLGHALLDAIGTYGMRLQRSR